MSTPISEAMVLDACRTLFGSGVQVSRDFLLYLQPGGAKSAFRRVAKESHPDLFASSPADVQRQQNDQFRQVLQAYELLSHFFKQRADGLWMPADRVSLRDLHQRGRRTARTAERFYAGAMPLRELEIGLYLYYRGSIPYRALIEALVWQRGQRPSIGELARRWNWLEDDEVRSVLSLRGQSLRFGERAVELGLLSPFHVKALLWYQRSQQERLGQFFVRKGYLSAADLDRMLAELIGHNRRVRGAPGPRQ